MKIASVAEVKSRFSAYLKASGDGPVIVTRNGRPVAVLLSIADGDELERLVLSRSRRFRAILDAANQQIRDGSAIGHDEFWSGVEAQTDESSPGRLGRPEERPSRRGPPGRRRGKPRSIGKGE